MGAGASSSGGKRKDTRGERYRVAIEFAIAHDARGDEADAQPTTPQASSGPADRSRPGDALDFFFHGSERYSPRIALADLGRRKHKHACGSKLEPRDPPQDLSGGRYRWRRFRLTFEYRDDRAYGHVGLVWFRHDAARARDAPGHVSGAALRVETAEITQVMRGGLKCAEGTGRTWAFCCRCVLAPGAEQHFCEDGACFAGPGAADTPPLLATFRAEDLARRRARYLPEEDGGVPGGKDGEDGEDGNDDGLPRGAAVRHDSDLLPSHQCGACDVKPAAAALALAAGLDRLTQSARGKGRAGKPTDSWQAVQRPATSAPHATADTPPPPPPQTPPPPPPPEDPAGDPPSAFLVDAIWPSHAEGGSSPSPSPSPSLPLPLLPLPAPALPEGKCFWRNDVHFARQFLGGPHCEMLVMVKDLEAQVPPSLLRSRELAHALEATQKGSRRQQKHLAVEAAAGRVFALDLRQVGTFVSTIECEGTGRYLAPGVLCLFYLADDPNRRFTSQPMALLPLCACLDADDPSAPIFTPLDAPWVWQTAKAFVSSADMQAHLAVAVLVNACAVPNAFTAALMAEVSVLHPVVSNETEGKGREGKGRGMRHRGRVYLVKPRMTSE